MAKERKKDKPAKPAKSEQSPIRFEDASPRDLFSRFFDEDTWLEPFGAWRIPRMLGRIDQRWFPRVDIHETEREVKVMADVPGVSPDHITIDVQGNRMTIDGFMDREAETEENVKPYRYERSYGEFRREFSLPAMVREEEVKAMYKDGVLTITLPKVEGHSKIKIDKQ
jgi:HSP20 family protein